MDAAGVPAVDDVQVAEAGVMVAVPAAVAAVVVAPVEGMAAEAADTKSICKISNPKTAILIAVFFCGRDERRRFITIEQNLLA